MLPAADERCLDMNSTLRAVPVLLLASRRAARRLTSTLTSTLPSSMAHQVFGIVSSSYKANLYFCTKTTLSDLSGTPKVLNGRR